MRSSVVAATIAMALLLSGPAALASRASGFSIFSTGMKAFASTAIRWTSAIGNCVGAAGAISRPCVSQADDLLLGDFIVEHRLMLRGSALSSGACHRSLVSITMNSAVTFAEMITVDQKLLAGRLDLTHLPLQQAKTYLSKARVGFSRARSICG